MPAVIALLANPWARALAIALLAILWSLGLFWRGYSLGQERSDQKATISRLEAALAARERDLRLQEGAAAAARLVAQDNERRAQEAQERLDDYAQELAARDDRCPLTPADLLRLQPHRPGPR